MQLKKQSETAGESLTQMDPGKIKTLIDTALGRAKADLVIANADLVNVYSGELLKGYSVAVKGDRIAYVGEDARHTVGPDTVVIEVAGKVLIPGLIDTHTHLLAHYTVDEFLRYAMKGGTTTIVSETIELVSPLGYNGVWEFLKATENQPVKVFATITPIPNISPAAGLGTLSPHKLQRLLKHERVLGLGEAAWRYVIQGDESLLRMFAQTVNMGKTLEGHSAGARGNNLAAYVASGVSSCHESITAEEALERLRLGLHTMVREGASRRDLEAVSKIKDEPVDFRRLVLVTDSVEANHLMEHGYMEFLVQKAIDLGFDPIVAIQMATLNAAEHFSLDNLIGGIAPGKYADMVLIPDLRSIKAEMVISNGRIIAEKGQVLVPPRKHIYSRSARRSVRLPRKLEPADFHVLVEGGDTPVTIRLINLVAVTLTREEQITIAPREGLLEADTENDILKVAVIERSSNTGKMFTGFVKGFGLKKGAVAVSAIWNISGITVVGTNDEDMAGVVNRVFDLQGGAVVYADGKILAEVPLPIGGKISDLPIEELCRRFEEIQQKAVELGSSLADIHLSLTALTTNAIPFLRICESGLMDIKSGELVDLFV